MIDNIDNIDPELIAAVVTFVIGMIEAARRFQATGKIPYKQLPWAAKRQLELWVRKSYFTKDRPTDEPSFVVDRPIGDVRTALAKQGFVPSWAIGAHYGGEDDLLRKYFYDPQSELPNRQIEVRLFEAGNRTEIMANEGPTFDHHPSEYLSGNGREYEPAIDYVKQRLENEVPVGYPGN